jgi:hypothetical protein
VYTHDFSDDWRHDIVVEKILPAELTANLSEMANVIIPETRLPGR